MSSIQMAPARPDVLLITIDTLRADRVGALGSGRGLTPSLDALAKDAVVFERAYAQAPITTVSHATILTGSYPPSHRVDDFGAPLGRSVPYLPAILKAAGYQTAAFVGSLILDPRNGTAPGFDRGFDRYDAGFRLREPNESRYETVERRGDEVARRALAWLGASDRKRPLFLWVHLFDPHDPYDPPADLKTRFASAPYDGEVAFADRQLGRLVSAIGNAAVVMVAGDHGESLGDHGESTHGVFLYDAALHVPLVLRVPGKPGGGRVATRVRLADVAPTLLELAGIAKPASMLGQSLRPLITDTLPREDRPVYAETSYPRRAFGWSPLVAWRADRYLLVRAPTRELYDLTADAGAVKNLASSRGRLADGLDAELSTFLSGAAVQAAEPAARPTVDPEVAQRLAALGYVSGSSSPRPTGVDPKTRIAVANTLHDAIVAVEDGAYARAVPLFATALASDPDIPIAQLNLGIAYARQRQYDRAIPALRRAATLQPAEMRAHYELGLALYQVGQQKDAASELGVVAAALPAWANGRYSLAAVYARIDRVADAITELKAALALEPRHFRANLLLGRLLTLTGKPADAVVYLQTAVDVDPKSTEARQFLADALARRR